MLDKDTIDFIGVGEARSGSTWLSACLGEHPDVLFSSQKSQKELHFFNSEIDVFGKRFRSIYDRGLGWYLDQFPHAQKGKIRGEFSVNYFANPEAAMRIKDGFPNVKILIILRSPVTMLYSHYWHCRASVEMKVPETFEAAVEERYLLERGQYSDHIKRFFDIFSMDQVKVIILEQAKKSPHESIQSVFKFLGISPDFVPPSLEKKVNTSSKERFQILHKVAHKILDFLKSAGLKKLALDLASNLNLYELYRKLNLVPGEYPAMDDATKQKLITYFAPEVARIEDILDIRLPEWKK